MEGSLRPRRALRISMGVVTILMAVALGMVGGILRRLASSQGFTPAQRASAIMMCVFAAWLLAFGVVAIAHVKRPTYVWRFLLAAGLAIGAQGFVHFDVVTATGLPVAVAFIGALLACCASGWFLLRRVQ